MLRSEAAMLEKQADNYIMAEFLVDENLPCYFHDFASRAAAAGLSFLALAVFNYPFGITAIIGVIASLLGPSLLMLRLLFLMS